MIRFYKIPDKTKKRIFQNTGEKRNLPAYAIEKDWWVVQTLSILFNKEIGEHLVFKGGTSLSKAWDMIERFNQLLVIWKGRILYMSHIQQLPSNFSPIPG